MLRPSWRHKRIRLFGSSVLRSVNNLKGMKNQAAEDLTALIKRMIAISHAGGIEYVCSLWPNHSWKMIQEKFAERDYVWIQWWKSGVENYLEDLFEEG